MAVEACYVEEWLGPFRLGLAVVVRSDVARSGVAGRSWFVSVWSGRVRSGG
jgi:hypothetical protein